MKEMNPGGVVLLQKLSGLSLKAANCRDLYGAQLDRVMVGISRVPFEAKVYHLFADVVNTMKSHKSMGEGLGDE